MGFVDSMAKEAVEIAKTLDTKVSFHFNSVTVNVTKISCWEAVANETLEAVNSGKKSVFGKGW